MNTAPLAARRAVLTIFFVNGATIASWVPHIPLVKEKLGLSEGLLGLALLGIAVGAVFSLTLSGWLIARFGSRAVTSVSTLAFCLALPLPVLAPSFSLLVLALVFFGLCNGAMDVAMNTQAVAVEELDSKPIMSSFHGFFSLGGLFGAGVGGLILAGGASPYLHVGGARLGYPGGVHAEQASPETCRGRLGQSRICAAQGFATGAGWDSWRSSSLQAKVPWQTGARFI